MSEPVRPRRAPPVRLAALVLSALCLTAITAGTATGDEPSLRAGDRPHRWSGYAIRATGDADGGWIGGYRVGDTTLYVVTPTKRPNRAGFEAPRAVDDAAGRATSQSETERAAWILSKYGGYRDATQAAAVDASVYHLLVGGKWKVGSPRGARRIRQSGDPASVRRFARIMLRQSRASAGAYTARLDATGADLGGAVAVTLSVVDGHGRPAAGLPVTLAMAGADPLKAVTGDDGRALGRFPANARGWQEVTATVGNVPDHRLHLWPAEKKGQAAAAEGGARRQVVVSTAAPVRGPQTLSLTADPNQLVVGSAARVLATVGGGDAPRAATAALHGPFASSSAVDCSGSAVGTVSAPVTNDGSYALPSVTVSGGGYYAWRVAVDGTQASMPVAACGATVKVRGRAVTAIVADAGPVSADEVGATGTVSGMPFADPISLTATLAGPYGSPQEAVSNSCAALPFPDVTRVRAGNGSVHFTVQRPTTPGLYAWQVQAAPGDLWLGSRSSCAASGSLLLVQ